MSAISAATTEQLTQIRAKRQAAQLYVVAITPPIVFAAQINGTPASLDSVVSITFDNVTAGAYTDILEDMTLWIGSAPGLCDIGQARLRSAAASQLTIGEESELRLQDGQYLSAMLDFGLWAKHIAISAAGTALIDGDIAYSDQNTNHSPLVVMGTHAIKEISGASASTAWDASESWCPGSTITDFLWTCAGGSIDDATSPTPEISFSQPGEYLVGCQVTAANGKSAIGWRWVLILARNDYFLAGVATATRARLSDVVTLGVTGHGLTTGDIASVSGLEDETYNVDYVEVTVIDPDTLSYPCVGDDESTQADTAGLVSKLVYLACPPLRLTSFDGSVDYQQGGVEFTFQMYGDAGTALIHDRSLVIVFADDYYDGVLGSVGQILDRENIVCAGWISAENLEADKNGGMVEFTASGPQFWLGAMYTFPLGIEGVITTPAAWTEMKDWTINEILAHFATWRCTLAKVCDVYPNDDTRLSPAFTATSASLWAQLTEMIERQILARPCSDEFGRVFAEVDTQFVPEADRTSIPVIQALLKGDILGKVGIERVTVPPVSRITLSGVSVTSGTLETPTYFSLAPGHVFNRFGAPETLDRLLLSSQSQANQEAGLILGQRNNEFPRIDIPLSENNRLVSVCPRQMLSVEITSDMTPRGVSYSGQIIPRTVSWSYQSGALLTSLSCEAETFEALSCNGDIPVLAEDGSFDFSWEIPALPEFPPYRPPVIAPPPAVRPLVPLGMVAVLVDDYGLYYTLNLADASPTWTLATTPTDWSGAEINALVNFELNGYGRAFLASETTAWSQLIGASGRTVIGDSAYFLANPNVGQTSYQIKGIGINRVLDQVCALTLKTNTGNCPIYKTGPSGILEYKFLFYPTMTTYDIEGLSNYQFSYYGEKWYMSYETYHGGGFLVRMNKDMTGTENGMGINTGTYGGPHIHAKAADFIFTQSQSGLGRVISTGNAVSNINENDSQAIQNVACDPTGRRLLTVNSSGRALRRSYADGLFWDTVTAFPHQIANWSARILNMGDLDKWLVISKEYGTNLLKIYYTDDFGATWTSKLGNLATLTATTASVLAVHDA